MRDAHGVTRNEGTPVMAKGRSQDSRTLNEKLHDKNGGYSPRDARQVNRPAKTRGQ